MIYINETLPNPASTSTAAEFIELYNSGSAAVSLGGYFLTTGGKKKTSLDGYAIPADGYLLLGRAQTKIALKNTDGAVFLYGPDGALVDHAEFAGAAPKGQSFSRNDYGAAPTQHFLFTYSSPGAENRTVSTEVAKNPYPFNISLVHQPSLLSFLALLVGIALFFLGFFIYATHKNRNISDLFFGRDEKVGGGNGKIPGLR